MKQDTMQIRRLLMQAAQLLGTSPTPRLDSEVLLAHVLGFTRSQLYAQLERILTFEEINQFQQMLSRRQQGEPIAYLTGKREFWSMELQVTPDTLIPRPETELLVELALSKIPYSREVTIADLGTGSGAIALAIAKERPNAKIYAVDSSFAALTVAKMNANNLGLTNVYFLGADWLTAFAAETFDVIVSNPPYISSQDPHLTQGDVWFEPRAALVGDDDGLAAYRLITSEAKQILKAKGWILFEHGYEQACQVLDLLQAANFVELLNRRDLAGQNRVSLGQKS